MNYPNCTLQLSPVHANRDLIVNPKCNLLIEVFYPRDQFVIDPNEIQYYGSDFNEPLIFQTIGYAGTDLKDAELSIMWYAAEHLEYPDMELSKTPL
jgi:hypothetical protein